MIFASLIPDERRSKGSANSQGKALEGGLTAEVHAIRIVVDRRTEIEIVEREAILPMVHDLVDE